jgi:hypothetical protein
METPHKKKTQCIKRRERQLLGNYVLHSKTVAQTMEFFLSESLGEDVDSLLGGSTANRQIYHEQTP